MSDFIINKTLEDDSLFITDLKLSQVRLLKNAAWPWLMLVPKRNDMRDIIDLSIEEQHILTDEIAQIGNAMKTLFKPDKLNIANLGNVISQLHIHIVARYKDDPAWPSPIWGSGISKEYESEKLEILVETLRNKIR